ncbi:AraC family transcriptional regulator [Cognatilysobacter bugurensis]|uniref:HTH araC/xylS-type domain-containing protein n=1 Tax=Cognatilysobacter bugurensis TaxID=543356 RepID=A0A918T2A8_9GAMM|nr:AraC family transcriptional regulator [Lysobacter bugurensis]GHA86187.1 hypothetical protein GCM10007067_25300 [Lysobacter bugurensis]
MWTTRRTRARRCSSEQKRGIDVSTFDQASEPARAYLVRMDPNAPPTSPHARLQRALAHIDAHLDEPIDIKQLAALAAYSPSHFQRMFSTATGIGVGEYRQAAYRQQQRRTPLGDASSGV